MSIVEYSQEKEHAKTREVYRLNVVKDKFVGVGQKVKLFSACNSIFFLILNASSCE